MSFDFQYDSTARSGFLLSRLCQVSSCCFCLSLQAGAGLTAGLTILLHVVSMLPILPISVPLAAYYTFLVVNIFGIIINAFGLFAVYKNTFKLAKQYATLYWFDLILRVIQSITYALLEANGRESIVTSCLKSQPKFPCAQHYSLIASYVIVAFVLIGLLMLVGAIVIQSWWIQMGETKPRMEIIQDEPLPPYTCEPPPYSMTPQASS